VTHEMSFAREVANRVIYMEDGQIIEDSPPEVMFTSAKEARSRQFLERVRQPG
jgi:ABC-type polar amino acid transport system ATPase subunit